MGNTEAPRLHSTKVQRVTVTKAKIEIKKKKQTKCEEHTQSMPKGHEQANEAGWHLHRCLAYGGP